MNSIVIKCVFRVKLLLKCNFIYLIIFLYLKKYIIMNSTLNFIFIFILYINLVLLYFLKEYNYKGNI